MHENNIGIYDSRFYLRANSKLWQIRNSVSETEASKETHGGGDGDGGGECLIQIFKL